MMKIENATHWRTSDIKRVILLALTHVGGDPNLPRKCRVGHATVRGKTISRTNRINIQRFDRVKDIGNGFKTGEIVIWLPRRGPRNYHHNPMVALAIATDIADAGITADTEVLAPSESYFLANCLAYEFAMERFNLGGGKPIADVDFKGLEADRRSVLPPTWADSKALLICKYRDPMKDAAFLDFVSKKEETIRRAEADMEKIDDEIAKLQDRRKRAVARKTQAAKAIRDAKKRRS